MREEDGEEEEQESEEEEEEEMPTEKKRKNFVFTGDLGKQVATELSEVDYCLGNLLDPGKTRTLSFSGYIPRAGKGDDNTTTEK